ncbi:MAG: hypothetical protein ACKOA1_05510 [Bacteroidota bacterium]
MKRQATVIILYFLTWQAICSAQGISAFSDYRGYFYAFDNGNFNKLEYLPINSFKAGSNGIAYVDNRNDFKVYSGGKSINLLNAADFKYWVTDYLVAYKVGQVLYVNDGADKKLLCYYNTKMTVSDSMVSWFDDSQYTFNIYYNGRTAVLENSLLEPPKAVKAGSNTLAWINQSNFFNVFYRGTVVNLDDITPIQFETGRDILAWVDGYNQYFNIFYNGDTAIASTFAPDSFKVGNGVLAYVDQTGNFQAFYNGGIKQLIPDRPDFFLVKGNLIVYAYNNQFNVYYNGKNYPVERYIPASFKIGLNSVAYQDPGGSLKFFSKGVTYTASTEYINDFDVTGDVLRMAVGTNTTQFFWDGQLYQQ